MLVMAVALEETEALVVMVVALELEVIQAKAETVLLLAL
jgi:hypothetical protein